MRRFKKYLALSTAIIMGLTSFSACSKEENSGEKKIKIGVAQLALHVSLDEVRDGFTAKLKELGYVDGENVEIDYKDAQGEPSNNQAIIDSFKTDKKDVILAIATSTSQAAEKISEDIPIVFAAVSDPVTSGLVESLENPGKNVTGVSDALDLERFVDLMYTLTPDIKKVGLLYNSGEVNSIDAINALKEQLNSMGKEVEFVEGGVTNTGEVAQAAQSLINKGVDALFTPTDNTLASQIGPAARLAEEAKIPFYVGADSMVKGGALATVGINYNLVGEDAAVMVADIINGTKKASEIPVKVYSDELSIYINKKTVEAIGITIPDSVKNNPKLVLI